MNLATNAWVVLAPDGTYVGRGNLFWSRDEPERIESSPRVHPDYQGLGIGTHLIRLMEQRVCTNVLAGGGKEA